MKNASTHSQFAHAVGLTVALGSVGVASHMGIASSSAGTPVDGSLQALYEAKFDAANPLRDIAISAFASLRWAAFKEGTSDVVVGKGGWLFTAEEFTTDPSFDQRLGTSIDRVAEVHQTLSDEGIKLVVVSVPDKADIYNDKLSVERSAKIALRSTEFTSGLRSHGVDVVDVSFTLELARLQGETFLRDDTHWSPYGSKVAASAIAERVEALGVSLTKADVSMSHIGVSDHDGDLLTFVDTGLLRPLFGPAKSEIAVYETTVEAGGDLFSSAPIDVALVGTSFSAKREWHFADFLQQELQAELINYAEEGQGPFAPMDAMLASEEFETSPPKLVIWEIPVRYTTLELPQ